MRRRKEEEYEDKRGGWDGAIERGRRTRTKEQGTRRGEVKGVS